MKHTFLVGFIELALLDWGSTAGTRRDRFASSQSLDVIVNLILGVIPILIFLCKLRGEQLEVLGPFLIDELDELGRSLASPLGSCRCHLLKLCQ